MRVFTNIFIEDNLSFFVTRRSWSDWMYYINAWFTASGVIITRHLLKNRIKNMALNRINYYVKSD